MRLGTRFVAAQKSALAAQIATPKRLQSGFVASLGIRLNKVSTSCSFQKNLASRFGGVALGWFLSIR
jgi:hypothetical protein